MEENHKLKKTRQKFLDHEIYLNAIWIVYTNLVPSTFFHYKSNAKKRPWNTSNTLIKICPNRGRWYVGPRIKAKSNLIEQNATKVQFVWEKTD